MRLDNARILLLGATGGIGAATARALADRGGRLCLAGRRRASLDALAEELGDGTCVVTGDVGTGEGRQALVSGVLERFGGVDLVINAAGVLDFVAFDGHDPAALERIFRTNVTGPMLLIQSLLPALRETRGRIVNVGSIFGSIAFPYFTAYSASKFAVRGFSEALRRELADSGVGVTYVAPRATRTAINSEAVMRMGEATGMNMDEPATVARALVRAVERDRDEAYFGWPESLFVKINALLPGLVDRALRRQARTMARFVRPERDDRSIVRRTGCPAP